MAKIFAVFGLMEDPTRVWPVVWSVDVDDCIRAKAKCDQQAKALGDALQVVWAQMEQLENPQPFKSHHKIYGKSIRNKDYDNQLTSYQKAREKLEADEADINRRHGDDLLDVLFPLGNEGWLPEVKYVVWTIGEDMRADFTPAELFIMRAKLHVSEEADSLPVDESEQDE